MTSPFVYRRVARRELEEAISWYDLQREGLGGEFYAEVSSCLTRIAESPERFRKIRGPIRRAILQRFPYTIHFVPEATRIVILAVFRVRRDPRQLEGHR